MTNLSTRIKEAEELVDKEFDHSETCTAYRLEGETDCFCDLKPYKQFLSQELRSLAEDMVKEIVPDNDMVDDYCKDKSMMFSKGVIQTIREIKQRLETYLK